MFFRGSLDYLFTELGSIYAEVKVSMEQLQLGRYPVVST